MVKFPKRNAAATTEEPETANTPEVTETSVKTDTVVTELSPETPVETAAPASAPRVKMTPAEKKTKQNAYYKQYREKLRLDPEKEAAYRKMKNDASKKFLTKQRALKADLLRQVEEAKAAVAGTTPSAE